MQAFEAMAYAYMPEPEPPRRILLATFGRDPKWEAAIALIRDGFQQVAEQAKLAMEELAKAMHNSFGQFDSFEDIPVPSVGPAWWRGLAPGFFALARPRYGGGRGDSIHPGGVSQRKKRRGRRCSPRPWSGR